MNLPNTFEALVRYILGRIVNCETIFSKVRPSGYYKVRPEYYKIFQNSLLYRTPPVATFVVTSKKTLKYFHK